MVLAAVLAQVALHVHLSAGVWVACVLTMAAYALYYSPQSAVKQISPKQGVLMV